MKFRFNIVVVQVVALAVFGVFACWQLSKGAMFHNLNALHLLYTIDVGDRLTDATADGVVAPAEIDALAGAVARVRAQPIACLDTVNAMDRATMAMIGTDYALEICVEDAAAADSALEQLDQFKAGRIDQDALLAG